MVAVNCAALPDHLLEAELFGHTKGAFTGAINARVGLFEQAHRGTIFLDEIGEMPLPLQAKLLRVLQEREIQRIGSSEPLSVDVRVIAASNTNLARSSGESPFPRGSLLPAESRRAAHAGAAGAAFRYPRAGRAFSAQDRRTGAGVEKAASPAGPGHVDEIFLARQRAPARTCAGVRLAHSAAPARFSIRAISICPPKSSRPEFGSLSSLDVPEGGVNFEELMTGIERRLLERALAKSGGNKARAANMLHMKRTTLISKFKSLEVCA